MQFFEIYGFFHGPVKDKLHFDIAYGLTDKLTLFANSSYEVAELDYTDEYVVESQKMDIFPCEFCENLKNLKRTCRTMQDLVKTYDAT